MLLPSSGCWKSKVQVSTQAGPAEGPCIRYLSQDLKEQEFSLAHGLRGHSPLQWGGHGRVHGGKELEAGTPSLRMMCTGIREGRALAFIRLSSFFPLVIQSDALPMGWHHTSSLLS